MAVGSTIRCRAWGAITADGFSACLNDKAARRRPDRQVIRAARSGQLGLDARRLAAAIAQEVQLGAATSPRRLTSIPAISGL